MIQFKPRGKLIRFRELWRNRSDKEYGFSMLEAVVVVGVLLSLAVGGFLSYGQITENAKIAKIKSIVSEVYTAVMVAQVDGDSLTKASDVIDQFNASSQKIRVEIRPGATGELLAAMPTGTYNPASGDSFCVTASMIEEESIFAELGDCSIPSEENEVPKVEEPVVDYESLMVTIWDTTSSTCREITLPIRDDVDVIIDWGDNTEKQKTKNDKPNHFYSIGSMNQKVTIGGKFKAWGATDLHGWVDSECLISIDSWGETETTNLRYAFIESDKLKRVEEIPSTVTSLYGAFYNVSSAFTLGNLDTSNVTDMSGMLQGASKFNQDLNFNTQNVLTMDSMFWGASVFNSTLTFDTRNVESMRAMFVNAKLFNKNLSSWNVDKVTNYESFSVGTNFPSAYRPKFK
jgi:surface protein